MAGNRNSSMEYRQLGNTDMQVSVLSFGAAALGWCYGEVDEAVGIDTVYRALDAGINYIDTAPWYGNSEEVVGKALKGIARDRYYLSTKVGQYRTEDEDFFNNRFDFSAETVTKRFNESLEKLGVDYVDLLQVHDIEFANLDQLLSETLPALQEIKNSGKARYLGITAYPLKTLSDVLSKSPVKLDTVLCYTRHTLIDTTLLDHIPEFQKYKVGIIHGSPTCMRLLTEAGPPDWHWATDEMKEAGKNAVAYCKEKGVSLAKIALQFSLSNSEISTTLSGPCKPEELQQNLDATKPLSKMEQEALDYIREKYFVPIKKTHWEERALEEGVKYWENKKK